jgi:ribosome-associated protein
MPPSAPDDDLRTVLVVNAHVAIPRAELEMRASRAGGPGGQHVNTSSTRIEVVWNVRTSVALSEERRARLLTKLASRIDAAGNLRVVASDTRSQRQNRLLAEERLAATVAAALVVPRVRRKTKPSRGAVERRLDSKRRQSGKKRERRERGDD